MRAAIDIARGAGRKVAFTLSDVFCINRHGGDFRILIGDGLIDILFANENELLALAEVDDFEAAVAKISAQVPVLVVTRSEKGAIAIPKRHPCRSPGADRSRGGGHDRRGRSVRCGLPAWAGPGLDAR
ncbi:hypothetical protein DdX_20460 [Ditylenchus destructor]|uniref:Carbohydrate kinase PfkB domain-containing protein n=1 Tax=Ditylenchus destructor TaxID=166010 RepID=A0AAD4MG83_9BILA|nr:hypothetical protein DdX_20460 [Ditylenchus destructor]